MTRQAANKCFEVAGLRPGDVDVVELHDCFSANELITYEALGLCAEGESSRESLPPLTGLVGGSGGSVGDLSRRLSLTPSDKYLKVAIVTPPPHPTGKAGEMIDRGDNTYGGKFVVNPSGGLISKGHPLGATGTWNPPHPQEKKKTPPPAATRWRCLTAVSRRGPSAMSTSPAPQTTCAVVSINLSTPMESISNQNSV